MRRRVVPTRAGWTLIGAGLGLLVGARLLGSLELAVLGLAGCALVGASMLWSATRSMVVSATREVVPPRASVGTDARAEIMVVNTGPRLTPTFAVTDAFDDGRRAARFLVAPLPPGEHGRGAYRLPTGRRGKYNLGPLAVTAHEPFGLSTSTVRALGVNDVLIRPRVHALGPLPTPPRANEEGTDVSARFALDADEFFTLRDYVVGDELRRVHWRTTARTGRIMVREDEARRRPAALVVFDTTAARYTADTFERAVEVAASACARFAHDGRAVELLAGGRRVDGLDAVLDHLAVIEPEPAPEPLGDTLRGVATRRGMFVVVTGDLDRPTVDAVRETSRRAGMVLLAACGFAEPPPSEPSMLVVPAARGDLAATWNRAVTTWTATGYSLAARSPR